MFQTLQSPLTLAGRILLSVLFITSGLGKIPGFNGVVGYIGSMGLPFPAFAATASIVLEVGAGVALLLGWRAQWAALLLAAFTLITAFVFHNFWAAPPAQVMAQQINFFKNIAISGGFLTLMAWGPGGWSLDARRVT